MKVKDLEPRPPMKMNTKQWVKSPRRMHIVSHLHGQSQNINHHYGSSRCGALETNPTRNHEVAGLIPSLAQWVKDRVLPGAVV